MYISCENSEEEFILKDSIIRKINDIKDCIRSRDRKFLNQVLKNQEVLWFINDKNAKGDNNINNLTIMYLSEYEKSKFNKPIDIKLFKIPSKVNKLKESEFV